MAKKPLTFKSIPVAGDDATFNFFLPIAKVDKKKRTVSGYASTATRDMDGEVIPLEAIKAALPGYMEWRNIREMHRNMAVGVAQEANVDSKGLYLTAKIVDNDAWEKCVEGVYKGFSIGGRKLEKSGDTITQLELVEISVVDRPANPDCRIEVVKSAKGKLAFGSEAELVPVKDKNPTTKALRKMAQAVDALAKAGPSAAHDGFSLPAPGPNRSPKDEEISVDKGGDMPDDGSHPYGDVTYADPGYQADKKKRYPLSSKKKVRAAWGYIHHAANRAKYSAEQATSIESKIKAAAKKFGVEIETDKKAAKFLRKLIEAEDSATSLPSSLTKFLLPPLELGEKPASQPEGPSFLSLKSAGRDMDSPCSVTETITLELAASSPSSDASDGHQIALDLGTQTSLSKVSKSPDVRRMKQRLKKDRKMDNTRVDQDGSELLKALAPMLGEDVSEDQAVVLLKAMRKAGKDSPMMKAKKALDDMKECRKSIKKGVEELHAMCKASYLAKQRRAELIKAGGKKPDKDDEDDGFDFGKAMSILGKTYGDVSTMKSLMKAADVGMEKAMAGRSGQRGQEAGDGMAGVYEVPPGVKDLSPGDLATAGPGAGQRGGSPPLYPSDGAVYPGKGAGGLDLHKFVRKDGSVPVEIAQLVAEVSKLQASNDILANLSSKGSKPYAFDLRKLGNGAFGDGGASGEKASIAKLYEGINPADLSSPEEHVQSAAASKIIGRMLLDKTFSKPIYDPGFNGHAGIKTQ